MRVGLAHLVLDIVCMALTMAIDRDQTEHQVLFSITLGNLVLGLITLGKREVLGGWRLTCSVSFATGAFPCESVVISWQHVSWYICRPPLQASEGQNICPRSTDGTSPPPLSLIVAKQGLSPRTLSERYCMKASRSRLYLSSYHDPTEPGGCFE